MEYYGFKPSLQDDMKNADLIISHGGEKELNQKGLNETSDQGDMLFYATHLQVSIPLKPVHTCTSL